jgi:hypothetical protein
LMFDVVSTRYALHPLPNFRWVRYPHTLPMASLIEHCPFWWLHHVPALWKQAEARPQAARGSPIRSKRHPQWKCCPRAFSISYPPCLLFMFVIT